MNKEVISDKQGISLMIMFILGTSSMLLTSVKAKKDFWLAIIIAVFFSLIIALVYSRLLRIFPGKDLFDILEICFGKIVGKGITLLFVWFIIHSGALVLRDTGEYMKTLGIPETPMIVTMIFIIILGIWAVKEGIEVMGRWSEFFLPIIILLIFTILIFLIPKMDINNVRPVLDEGIKPVWRGALEAFTFPFAETVVFTIVFSTLKWNKSPYKIYFSSLLIGGMMLLFISLANVLVLGAEIASKMFYPTYATMSRLKIADFVSGMEVVLSFALILGAFIKFSIYLLSVCKGITKVFGYSNYRFIVIPVSLLILNLSYSFHDSIIDYFRWYYEIWDYYAFPFQVILPIIILVAAEMKNRMGKKTNQKNLQ